MTTTLTTGARISLISIDASGGMFAGWSTRRDAAAALAALRETGRNVERCVQVHPAHNRFFRFWVIARPDPLSEFTWLMLRDGSWSRGRMYDDTGKGAPWVPMPTPEPIPATITHNYRYSAGSEEVIDLGAAKYGWDGRPLPPPTQWFAKAWCVACVWSHSDTDEHSVRAVARTHRANPGDLPLRSEAGRLLSGQEATAA